MNLLVSTLAFALVLLCAPSGSCDKTDKAPPLNKQHHDSSRNLTADAKRIIDFATKDSAGAAYDWLANITDTFGHRMVGEQSLEDAIDYTVKGLKAQGFDNVHTEDVPGLPKWVRGEETAVLLYPRRHRLHILAVGGSYGGEVNAPALVVRSFAELKTYGDQGMVKGKIVVYNQRWKDYGVSGPYRYGAKQAEGYGALGTLIRSVTSFSINSPHTGLGNRLSDPVSTYQATIPSACISVEEAEMLDRMQKRGQHLQIYMKLTAHYDGTITSRNTIFELTGTEKPQEVVLLSGHLDSWDVGQGAMDDGGGCAAVWHSLTTLKALGFRPKRTIRVVLWTAEEQQYLGAKHYYKTHKGGSERFVFVSETDQGAFKPTSYNATMSFSGTDDQFGVFSDIVRSLINANDIPLSSKKITPDGQGDVTFWANDGSPATTYLNADKYEYIFYFHHTEADYMTVFEPEDLDFTGAIFAVIVHAYANNLEI